jgi:hypothetical protein
MASFTRDDGMRTARLPVAWALRIRVNISAMGSVMLMFQTSFEASISESVKIRDL